MPETVVTAPVAPVTVPSNQFTSVPVVVAEPVTPTAEPVKVEPKPESPNVIAALAKASNESRLTKKQLAERDATIATLQAELETAKAGGSKASEIQAELDAIIARPGLLLKKGKTFQEILDSIAEPDAVADPKLTELEQRLAAREKADQEAKEAADKAKQEQSERDIAAGNENARKYVATFAATEGVKLGQDGVERWALVSMDASAIERARVEVLEYVTKNNIEQTDENVQGLLAQAFDQMEQVARDDNAKRNEKLKRGSVPASDRRSSESFIRPSQDQTEVQLRHEPGITAAIRGNPLPPPSAPKAPSFTGLLR
jgi:hypothetical protein